MKFSITGQVKDDLLIQVTTGSSRHQLIRHLQTWLSWKNHQSETLPKYKMGY